MSQALKGWVGLNRQREGNHKQGNVCSKMMSKEITLWWGFEPTSLEREKPAWSRGEEPAASGSLWNKDLSLWNFAGADMFPALSRGSLLPTPRSIWLLFLALSRIPWVERGWHLLRRASKSLVTIIIITAHLILVSYFSFYTVLSLETWNEQMRKTSWWMNIVQGSRPLLLRLQRTGQVQLPQAGYSLFSIVCAVPGTK